MVSKLELDAASKKLAQRSNEASEKAQRKLEKERILAERKKKREEAVEREIQQRRLAQLLKEEAEAQELERLQEINNGVVYKGVLQAVPAPESIASNKGIKRAADKALLPASVGRMLLSQDASKNGAYYFEVENDLGRRTCVGLLDFSSAEGFIALPKKAARCLWGPDAETEDCISGPVTVVYRKLSKGTKVVFQPRSAHFQQVVGDDIREVLETCLLRHSCLTVGDWVTVMHGEHAFDLRVKELEPASSVSVIDTEMEAEVHPSVETEERIFQEEMEARRLLEERERKRREEEEAAKIAEEEQQERRERHAAIVRQKLASLPSEPLDKDTSSEALRILFRFPDGTKYTRTFLPSQSIGTMFHFVDAMGAHGLDPGTYRLVSQYPRHVFEYVDQIDDPRRIEDLPQYSPGSNVVLFLEPIDA